MEHNEQKISQFVQAITAYAEGQRDQIRRETEAFKADLLFKAEQEALTDVYRLVQQETAKLRGEAVREISRHDRQARQALLARRNQILDEVADEVRQKLHEFTESADYPALLARLLTQAADLLPAQDTVYYVGAQDAAHLPSLRAVCPAGSRLDTADDIVLGGLRGENAAAGLLVDNTLDSRLEQQLEWFTASSGLTLE